MDYATNIALIRAIAKCRLAAEKLGTGGEAILGLFPGKNEERTVKYPNPGIVLLFHPNFHPEVQGWKDWELKFRVTSPYTRDVRVMGDITPQRLERVEYVMSLWDCPRPKYYLPLSLCPVWPLCSEVGQKK